MIFEKHTNIFCVKLYFDIISIISILRWQSYNINPKVTVKLLFKNFLQKIRCFYKIISFMFYF